MNWHVLYRTCSRADLITMRFSTRTLNISLPIYYSNQNRVIFAPPCRHMGKLATSFVSASPLMVQPYMKLMRLDRPIGTWLLYWPCAWSIGLAATAGSFPNFYMLFLFGVGALTMRGAGCTINDMWDRDIDSKVERTRTRPIASGQITMVNAFIFLSGLLALGDIILLQLNWESIVLGASSLGLVVTYPLAKRFFSWPQLSLGLVFNWGAFLGWTAIHGSCKLSACLPLYLACISWTLIYDTIYAHQDKKDDISIGVKSTAITFGRDTKQYLYGFSATMAGGLATAGFFCDQTAPYYLAVALAISRLIYQIRTLNINDPSDCGEKFTSNSNLGFIIMGGIIAGNLMRKEKEEIKN